MEVMILIFVLSIAALAVMPVINFSTKQSMKTKEKSFATEKAMQIIEELRAVVFESDNTYVLQEYDNGTTYSPILTINKNIADPGDPTSGNVKAGSNWKYCRQISVVNIANNPGARKVFVRVFKADDNATATPTVTLAEIVSVLKVVDKASPPTQVYDVYLIAIENVPGWWSSIYKIKPIMDSVINDLQARSPGLEVRVHWIRKLATGRDPYYTPYINMSTYSNELAAAGKVYYYPGLMHNPTSGGDSYYYHSDLFSGRICVDGGTPAGAYPLADQYNNAVRCPEESPSSGGEPNLRTLLEDMNSNPDKYMNAIFVNLHGELLPFPPLRNYSDAAKDPVSQADWRLVAHPDKLQYNGTENINLRVYTYVMNPDSYATTVKIPVSTIYFPGQIITVEALEVLDGSNTVSYNWRAANSPSDYELTTYNESGIDGTVIKLKNSPVRHPWKNASPKGGLHNNERLYGLEYIPCPVEAAANFSLDLTDNSQNNAKNTARWRIRLTNPGMGVKGYYEYDASIGDEWMTGTSLPPENISRNYFWVVSTPPVTEQYQFVGDPRHVPYSDVKLAHHYNWYFQQISGSGYAGFDRSANYWSSGGSNRLIFDVPRMFSIYRQALQRTNSIWTSITGWSNYYIGIGGELGADASNGFPSGLPLNARIWVPGLNVQKGVDEINANTSCDYKYTRIIAKDGGSWYSRYWIGELCPDSAYSSWKNEGNLNTGSTNYYREHYDSANTTNLSIKPSKTTQEYGCSSFFNGKPSASNGPFRHTSSTENGLIQNEEKYVAKVFNFPLPATIAADRPFTLNYGTFPMEWANYAADRTTISTITTFYECTNNASNYDAAAQLKFENGVGTGYAILNGLAPQINFGTAQMGKLAIVNSLRGFMNVGLPSIVNGRIPQLLRVDVVSPNPNLEYTNAGPITVTWDPQWTRWDGSLYTESYPANFDETEPIVYNVKYSADNGSTWKFLDNTPAVAGVRNPAKDISEPQVSCIWDVTGFLKGTYQIRVEAFRQNRSLHYSYHQTIFYLNSI